MKKFTLEVTAYQLGILSAALHVLNQTPNHSESSLELEQMVDDPGLVLSEDGTNCLWA